MERLWKRGRARIKDCLPPIEGLGSTRHQLLLGARGLLLYFLLHVKVPAPVATAALISAIHLFGDLVSGFWAMRAQRGGGP